MPTDLLAGLNPAWILILGGVLLPLIPGGLRRTYMLALPVLGALQLWFLPDGSMQTLSWLGLDLTPLRLDALSFCFGLIFFIASFIAVLYALHSKDWLQHVAALVYAGAAVGAVLAGDLLTLFLYWELTAIASVFLIWARRTHKAYVVGLRYLVIQIISGVLLLAGTVLYWRETGSLDFNLFTLDSFASLLIFLAFGIKCAFPLLHNWMQDAYPEATVTGTVVLSAFTTKLAVYALARGFAGTEILIPIGVAMTVFPIFFAVIENDMRRVLAYSLNNQLGFMVAGIGVGTALAINGTVAHAFAHILYKALLFMAMGAVLYRVGTIKASELGGLYKSMPWTARLCIIGSLSISAFPLFSGFVTKSMVLTAVADEGYWIAWLFLLLASAGVLDHSGIKIPFFTFFAHDSGKRCQEAPTNMLIAMSVAAVLSVGIGIYPDPLYAILPNQIEYSPYTVSHVMSQLQLLFFAALGFVILYRNGWYPPEIRGINLDFDWLYRRAGTKLAVGVVGGLAFVRQRVADGFLADSNRLLASLVAPGGGLRKLSSVWSAGAMSLIALVFLLAGLLLFLI